MCPTTHIIHMVKIDLVLFHSSSGLKITRLHNINYQWQRPESSGFNFIHFSPQQ